MKRRYTNDRVFYILTALVIALLTAVSGTTSTTLASAQSTESPLIPLRVTVFPYLSFAPLYIAHSEGFFTQQGLDVELIRFQNNSESLAALLTGRVDVDTIFTVGLLNAIVRGEKVRVVANKGLLSPEKCPADGFMVRTDLAEQLVNPTPGLLKKLTYGVDPVWLDSYFLEQALNDRGLKLADVTTKYVPNPAVRMEALAKGTLDVAFLSEPFISRALESGGIKMWLPAAAIVPNFSLGVIAFGPNLLSKDREGNIGVRFLHAYLQGITRLNEGKTARNIKILAKATQLDPETLSRICWPSYDAKGFVNAAAISGYSKWAVERGLSDRALLPEEFWDPSFIKSAGDDSSVQK